MKQDNSIIKVLQVNAGTKGYGGVSAIVFNIYKNIDKEKVQFDFLSPNKTTYGIHRKDIEKMGGNIYELNIDKNKIINKVLLSRRLNECLRKNKYDIIHINSGSFFFNLQVAMIAKKNRIKRIIVHSHNTLNEKNKIKNLIVKIFKPVLNYYATDFMACSKKAATAMFTKKVATQKTIIIKNGINIDKFKFNEIIREKIRKELNIEDNFVVIGHVGRFVPQKNHDFLIDCFNEIYKLNKNTVLLLIGEGELEEKIKEKVSKLNLHNNVKFLGLRKNVNEIMQAMDVFVLPSLYEGLPIVGIEAQAAGLKCVMSDTITSEVDITNNVQFLNLEADSLSKWSKEILKYSNFDRKEIYKDIITSGYDIKSTADMVLKIYEASK